MKDIEEASYLIVYKVIDYPENGGGTFYESFTSDELEAMDKFFNETFGGDRTKLIACVKIDEHIKYVQKTTVTEWVRKTKW